MDKNINIPNIIEIDKNHDLKSKGHYSITTDSKIIIFEKSQFNSKNKKFSTNKIEEKLNEFFDFLSISPKNNHHLETMINCVNLFEKLTNTNFYSPSEFYLYYKSKINKLNLDKTLKGSEKIQILLEEWMNKLEESEKKPYEDKAAELSFALMRKKFEVEMCIIKKIRYELISENMIFKIKNDFLNKKCSDCWLLNKSCICKKIKSIDFKSNFFILLHNKEFLRASNTSKIFSLMHKDNFDLKVSFIILGLWEHDKKIELLLKDKNFIVNSIILYPDKNSISSERFYQNVSQSEKNETEKIKSYMENLNIIILDGTWSQASNLKKMIDNFSSTNEIESNEENEKENEEHISIKVDNVENKKIQSISIKFNHDNKNVFNNLRKSPSDELCSTLQAVAILLFDLGYEKEIYETLINNLNFFVEVLCNQNRRKMNN